LQLPQKLNETPPKSDRSSPGKKTLRAPGAVAVFQFTTGVKLET